MATRKSGDDAPGSKAGEQRPGSYAQISSGTRRKRKGKKQRGAASSVPAAVEPDATHGLADESDDGDARADIVDSAAVDDLRTSKAAPTRSARRALGPLGMAEQVTAPPQAEAEAKPKSVSQPRVNVVEINPAELAAVPAPAAVAPTPRHAVRAELVDALLRDARERPTAPPPQERRPERSGREPPDEELHTRAQRPELDAREGAVARADSALRVSQPASPWGADELALRGLHESDTDESSELDRPSLSSVFDARPSIRPSPAPLPEKGSPALWLVVTLLCSIIAAAGIVALRDALDDEPAPRAPRTATSAPVADALPSEPAARPLPPASTEGADPLPSFEEGRAAARPVLVVDASVARVPPPRRVVRPLPPPVASAASPAVEAPAAASALPPETLPANPYAD